VWGEIGSAILVNLSPVFIAIVFAGSVVGAIIGALPGLSSISAIALVLPFTFGMDPSQGLVLLAAVYMSAEFGGSIPAILIGTPGTSGAIMTMLDGYPMTKKGEAQEALYLQLFAGTAGGLMGALVLIFFTPPLARASLLLGPAEYFWLAAAGLTLIAAVAGRSIAHGLIAVLIGVLLTVPGQDDMTGQLRFTFGSPDLVGGLPEVPLMLGLFAIGSVLLLMEQKEERVAPLNRRPGVIRYVLHRMKKMTGVIAWTSFVGIIVGIIPGLGANTAAVAAYSEAKRVSKNKEEFGTGAWEGVAAPEAANNSIIGGVLVPLLGLGIPGSPAAAIMYGALTVHGIIAGPRLFTQRADVAYTFMVGLAFTAIAMLIVGLISVRYLSLVVRAPVRFVIPTVLGLTLFGTFAFRNNMFDVVVLVFAGTLGFVLDKIGISWVPLTLGLVLGLLLEQSFQQSVLIGSARGLTIVEYWLSRPLSVAFAVLVLMMLIGSSRQVFKGRHRTRQGTDPSTDASRDGSSGGPSLSVDVGTEYSRPLDHDATAKDEREARRRWITQRTATIMLAGVLLAVSIYVFIETRGWRERATDMPILVGTLLGGLAVVLLVNSLRPNGGDRHVTSYPFAGVNWRLWVPLVMGLLLIAHIADELGFYVTIFIYLLGATFLLSRVRMTSARALGQSVLFSVCFIAFLYVIFHWVLRVPTPSGILV